jgi:hypothetical protein
MTDTVDAIKSPATEPTGDIDHLINHLAVIVRATRDEYGLTDTQKQQLYHKFSKIYDAYPREITDRVLEASNANALFWKPHSDTVLKYLHDAGILVDTLGV